MLEYCANILVAILILHPQAFLKRFQCDDSLIKSRWSLLLFLFVWLPGTVFLLRKTILFVSCSDTTFFYEEQTIQEQRG